MNIFQKIECIESDKVFPKISQSLSNYLYDIKEKIHLHNDAWDEYKKYTNPYEYIHSMVPHKKKSIAKYKPLSRSYFKMIEILDFFKLHNIDRPLSTFHLAEGPGGFIEALVHQRNCKEDKYIGMTLLDDLNDENIPAWKKTDTFLKQYQNVFIESGYDKTGNILVLENLDYCVTKYGSSMDIITADGGFDFSVDFNNQECIITKLLFAQTCFALCMQKKEGSFVLKVFDCFNEASIDILYILSAFYKKTYITKPQTSRCANSEKYIVCKGFLYDNCSSFLPLLRNAFSQMIQLNESKNVSRFLSFPISHYFLSRLEEYNSVFGQQQIENIHSTLLMIESKQNGDKLEAIVKANIQKCVIWCSKHNIQYNQIFSGMNTIEVC